LPRKKAKKAKNLRFGLLLMYICYNSKRVEATTASLAGGRKGRRVSGLILTIRRTVKRNRLATKILRRVAAFFRDKSYRKASARINKSYKQLAEKYNRAANPPAENKPKPFAREAYPVWVCWLQGEENMPETVKMCYDALLKRANGHKVTLITEANYLKFIDVPEYIREKYEKGMISHTHFSEVVRVSLLAKYGGLWIDATIYVSEKLPSFNEFSFWTGRWTDGCDFIKSVRRSSFLLYCLPDCPFACFIKECFYKYCGENDTFATYLLIDIFMDLAYDEIRAVRELIDSVPATKRGMLDLYAMLNSEYNKEEYNALCEEISFHKLTYKDDFKKYTKEGNLTFYGYLMREYEKKS
jgi:hypothetical protein